MDIKRKFFIAGTDTDVGKTFISAAILSAANTLGYTTLGLKPIAAGCHEVEGKLRNDDALLLQKFASVDMAYDQVNPIALKQAVAPHIAAENEGRRLGVSRISGFVRGAMMTPANLTLVEGAGGWRVPLNPVENMAHLVKELNLPVILVVGVRLGCINHSLLTAEAISNDGLKIAGWVANCVDPNMGEQEANIASLVSLLPFPLLGKVPFIAEKKPQDASRYLDVSILLNNGSSQL